MIEIKGISKLYDSANEETIVLNNISFKIVQNGLYSIVGKSGSGKSTFLNLIGLLETPSKGEILFNDEIIDFKNQKQCEEIRTKDLGFVFQDFNLLIDFNVIENIKITGLDNDKDVINILKVVNLENKIHTPVRFLSGGEKQRLAIARALAKNSRIILLDEPTGNLDAENTKIIFSTLKQLSKDRIIILVTHDLVSAYNFCDKVFELDSGNIVSFWEKDYSKEKKFVFANKKIDTISEVYNFIRPYLSEVNRNFKVKFQNNQYIELEWNQSNVLKNIDFILEQSKGEYFSFILNDVQEDSQINNFDFKVNRTKKLKFSFCFRYALVLIRKKSKRFFINFFLLTLSLLLILLYINISSYNKNDSAQSAILKNPLPFLPIESQLYNINSDEIITYNYGKYLDNRYQMFEKISYFDVEMEHKYHYSSNDTKLPIRIILTNEVGLKVSITDFASKYLFDSANPINEQLKFINNYISQDYFHFKITDTIQTDYNLETLNLFLTSNDYSIKHLDKLNMYYNVIYISKEAYIEELQNKTISLRAGNFALSEEITSVYASKNDKLNYQLYQEEVIYLGEKPLEKNQIVITKGFYDKFLNNLNLEEVIGKIWFYKDIYTGVNANLYQNISNLFDITPNVKIVGITNDTQAKILVNEEFYANISAEMCNYNIKGLAIANENLEELIICLHKNEDKISLNYIQPVYSFDALLNSFANNILLVLGVILFSITTLSIMQYTSINVQSKHKEIAIFRSLGKSKPAISNIYYIHNLFQTFIATLFSFIFGSICILLINNLIQGEDFFNINYNLLSFKWFHYLIPLLLGTFISLASTFVSLLYALKEDINIVIKNN